MSDGIEGGPIRRPVVGDDAFFRGLAARTVADFAKNLAAWAIQPHPEPLPEGWADANRRRLNDARELVQQNFAGQSSVLRDLQEFAEDAKELIIILQSDPGISTKPVQDWPIQAYRDVFERVKAGQQKFRGLADRLRAEDEISREELQQWRVRLNQAARRAALASTGIGRIENPFEKARRVLEEFGWIEGVEPPFDPAGVAFDPAAVQAWGFCVDAVAALPECSGGMMGISRRLQLRFDGTHSSPAGGGSAGIIWRWENAPSGPWVNRHELQALRIAGAEWERQQSRAVAAAAAVETDTHPASRAIVEAPQTSPQGASDTQPGSTSSDSAAGAAAPQGASGAGGDSGDQTEVNAKALADHCGCSDRQIREVLSHFDPSRKGNRGQLWWKYGLILKTLRQWSTGTEPKRKRYKQWPENAAELQKRKKPHPERSKK